MHSYYLIYTSTGEEYPGMYGTTLLKCSCCGEYAVTDYTQKKKPIPITEEQLNKMISKESLEMFLHIAEQREGLSLDFKKEPPN